MNLSRLNAYRIMWLFVFFDLPVTTKRDRRRATRFRKDLLNDGFTMLQFSVYIRHCPSKESRDVHAKRIRKLIPPNGHVSILSVTDKQYGRIIDVWGNRREKLPKGPPQMELF